MFQSNRSGDNTAITLLRSFISCLLVACIFQLLLFGEIQAQEKPYFRGYWDNSYRLSSEDGNFDLSFGGRIQAHYYYFNQERALDEVVGVSNNRSEFRRLRIYTKGIVYRVVEYKMELEFANGTGSVTDAFIRLREIPFIGNIQFGHFKEPFSLDMMNSSNNMTFIERAPMTAFKKQRNNGVLISNTLFDQRMTLAGGVFYNTDNSGRSLDEERYNITGRVTTLPYMVEDKNHLLHLGLAYSYREPSLGQYNVRSRPETNIGPRYVNTGIIQNAQNRRMTGVEIALLLNNLSFQSEYIITRVETTSRTYTFSGYYVEASWFLTGEHKNYSQKAGFFKKLSPKNNFDPSESESSYGAVELAIRLSHMDLNDNNVEGGILNDFTSGINWYLNPVTKFSLNHTIANLRTVGIGHIVQLEVQLAL